jgi:coenzyme Q-binding protein COQ10
MPQFSVSRFVAVPPDVAFAIAADVEGYKDFLPLLQRSTVRGAKLPVGAGEQFKAELVVAYDKLRVRESFVSTVTTNPKSRVVTATSTDGPMKSLDAQWRIVEADGGSTVTIAVDYVLRSALLQFALGGVVGFAAEKIMTAFENKAVSINLSS